MLFEILRLLDNNNLEKKKKRKSKDKRKKIEIIIPQSSTFLEHV